MKIGILRVPAGVGGAEVTLSEMAAVLLRAGHDVWFHLDDGPHVRKFNAFGSLRARVAPAIRALLDERCFSGGWAIEQLARTDVAIVIHRSHFPESLALAVDAVPRKLVYVPGKNPHHVTGRHEGGPPHGERITNVERFLFNSAHTLRLHARGAYPPALKARFVHLHPPLDLEAHAGRTVDALRLEGRQRLQLETGAFAVGVIGRLIPSKQPLAAVETASALALQGVDVRLHFVGDGPLRAEVEAAARRFGLGPRARITGMSAEPSPLIAAMDAVLHLCEHESLSRALREAMLLARPVVAFDGAGNRELCAGILRRLLFREPGEAVRKLRHLAGNAGDRLRYGRCARDRVLSMEQGAAEALLRLVAP